MNLARILLVGCALGVATMAGSGAAWPQGTVLFIEIGRPNPDPVRPTKPVNTLQDLSTALRGCWKPPPLDQSRAPIDVTFQVSFKRSGELFGRPRVITFAQQVTPEERGRYYTAVAEALDLCSRMPFTDAMGAAVAGRPFRVNIIDVRNRKQAEVPWLTTKTS